MNTTDETPRSRTESRWGAWILANFTDPQTRGDLMPMAAPGLIIGIGLSLLAVIVKPFWFPVIVLTGLLLFWGERYSRKPPKARLDYYLQLAAGFQVAIAAGVVFQLFLILIWLMPEQ